jgi:tetratricopeptide (TPR) repeat protein
MAKTLPSGQIQVESGDTLYGIYGSDWKKLSGYTGDPSKLQIGTILPAKPTTTDTTPSAKDVLSGTGANLVIPPETPSPTSDLSGANAKISSYQAGIDEMQKKLDKMQADYEAKTKEAETPQTPTSVWQKIMGTTSTPPEWVTNPNWLEEQKAKLWESTGMKSEDYFSQFKSDLAEVVTLKGDYDKAVAAKNQALLREEDRLAPEAVIAGKMSRVEKEANLRLNAMSAQINTKLGIMEMKKGNFTDAKDFVNQGVQDYLNLYRIRVDSFQKFYDINKDTIDSLKTEYKDIFNKSWDLAKLKLTQEESRVKQIAEWIKGAPDANWGSNPLDLTLDEATKIYQQGFPIKAPEVIGSAETGYKQWNSKTGKWEPILGGGVGVGGGIMTDDALQNAFNFVLVQKTLDKNDRAYYKNLFNAYVTSGNTRMAKDLVRNMALDTMGQRQQEEYTGAQNAIQRLQSVREAFKNYTEAGGKTNIVVGVTEAGLRKLGFTLNPKLADLQTQLSNALIDYRRSMTGVQFSYKEAQQYVDMFANSKNTMTLNNQLLNTMETALSGNMVTLMKIKVGASNYDAVFGGGTEPSGDNLTDEEAWELYNKMK